MMTTDSRKLAFCITSILGTLPSFPYRELALEGGLGEVRGCGGEAQERLLERLERQRQRLLDLPTPRSLTSEQNLQRLLILGPGWRTPHNPAERG
jgi:hypothetical protein